MTEKREAPGAFFRPSILLRFRMHLSGKFVVKGKHSLLGLGADSIHLILGDRFSCRCGRGYHYLFPSCMGPVAISGQLHPLGRSSGGSGGVIVLCLPDSYFPYSPSAFIPSCIQSLMSAFIAYRPVAFTAPLKWCLCPCFSHVPSLLWWGVPINHQVTDFVSIPIIRASYRIMAYCKS